ncbi:MAG TPA: tyrosine-type recombinase/integrase [Stellaceae bacterium]|nr:tyrosine-type recombinase/integrase [Stellaceae bacterium]
MYLHLRHRTWWASHDVPPSLRAALGGRKRFVSNLRTHDHAVAKVRAALLAAQWLAEIERARGTHDHDAEAEFWRKALAKPMPEAERRAALQVLAYEAELPVTAAALKAGIVSDDDPRYRELPEFAAAERFVGAATGKLVKLDEHLDAYLKTLAGKIEKKSIDMRRSAIEKARQHFPHIADVTRKTVHAWIEEISSGGAARSTVKHAVNDLRGYWKYLVAIEAVPDGAADPFDRLTVVSNAKKTKGDERKPFEPDDVARLLAEARKRGDGQLADLIDLAAYTGARLEELAALPVSRVNVTARYFEIVDAKSAAGWRQVPLHSRLLATVKRLVTESADGFVLTGLPKNRYGARGEAIGKRFTRLKTDLGFGPPHVFHSIRKTVATLLEGAGVSENVAADLLGHEKPRITYGLYSGGASLALKAAAIEKLAYPRDTEPRRNGSGRIAR